VVWCGVVWCGVAVCGRVGGTGHSRGRPCNDLAALSQDCLMPWPHLLAQYTRQAHPPARPTHPPGPPIHPPHLCKAGTGVHIPVSTARRTDGKAAAAARPRPRLAVDFAGALGALAACSHHLDFLAGGATGVGVLRTTGQGGGRVDEGKEVERLVGQVASTKQQRSGAAAALGLWRAHSPPCRPRHTPGRTQLGTCTVALQLNASREVG